MPATVRGKTFVRVGVLPRSFARRYLAPNCLLLYAQTCNAQG